MIALDLNYDNSNEILSSITELWMDQSFPNFVVGWSKIFFTSGGMWKARES